MNYEAYYLVRVSIRYPFRGLELCKVNRNADFRRQLSAKKTRPEFTRSPDEVRQLIFLNEIDAVNIIDKVLMAFISVNSIIYSWSHLMLTAINEDNNCFYRCIVKKQID